MPDVCRESNGPQRRLFLGALIATAWSGSASASNLTANSWPTAAPALMYRDPTRQPILSATLHDGPGPDQLLDSGPLDTRAKSGDVRLRKREIGEQKQCGKQQEKGAFHF